MNATLVLNKFNFKKIREISHFFEECFEIDSWIIFSSKQNNTVSKYSMRTSEKQNLNLPLNHNLKHLVGCPTKKNLIGITENRQTGSSSIVFWGWNAPDFRFILDEIIQPDGIKVLGNDRVAVFGQNRLKIYEISSVQCVQNLEVETSIQEIHVLSNSFLLLISQDESFYSLDLNSKKTLCILPSGSQRQFVYLEQLQLLLDSTDINRIKKIEI
jgi:hypothetical protein